MQGINHINNAIFTYFLVYKRMLVSIDKTIHVWEIDQTEPSYSIETPIKIISCANFHKDCRKLFVAGKSDLVFQIDIYTRAKKGCQLPENDIRCAVLNNESDLYACGSSQGNIYIIDVKDFSIVKTLSKYPYAITSIDFLKDQHTIIAGDSAGHLLTGSLTEDLKDYAKLTAQRGPILSLCTLSNGDVAAFQGKSLYIYDMYYQEILDVHDFGQSAIIKNNHLTGSIFIGTDNGKIYEYTPSTKMLLKVTSVSHSISALAINPEGIVIAIAFLGGLHIINLQDPSTNIEVPCNHKEFITTLVYQHNFIAIPDDAIFETDTTNPSQIWISRSKMSQSRTQNSMRISSLDLFQEEEDFSVDKFTFRRKLMDIATNNIDRTAGSKILSRSGISLSKMTRRSLHSGESNEVSVSGQLSFSESGSPIFQKKLISKKNKIDSPSISNFPIKEGENNDTLSEVKTDSPTIKNSPPTAKTPSKVRFGNQVTPQKASESGSPQKQEEPRITFVDLQAKSPEQKSPADDEEIHSSDFSNMPSPMNDASQKLDNVNNGLDKAYDEITERVQEAEEKINERKE